MIIGQKVINRHQDSKGDLRNGIAKNKENVLQLMRNCAKEKELA